MGERRVNGYIVPLKSPEILAEKIIRLIKNKNDGIRYGENNRRLIEEKNNREKEMGKMGKLYEEIVH